MNISSDVIERLPRVEGLLNYLSPMAEKPMNLTYEDRKSTRLNSSHLVISYAVFCLKKKKHLSNACGRLWKAAAILHILVPRAPLSKRFPRVRTRTSNPPGYQVSAACQDTCVTHDAL